MLRARDYHKKQKTLKVNCNRRGLGIVSWQLCARSLAITFAVGCADCSTWRAKLSNAIQMSSTLPWRRDRPRMECTFRGGCETTRQTPAPPVTVCNLHPSQLWDPTCICSLHESVPYNKCWRLGSRCQQPTPGHPLITTHQGDTGICD